MDDIFIGGGGNNASKILKVAPLFIALLFVIISLGTMPGTIGHRTKYVKKDDPDSELKLSNIAIPVTLLSLTLVLLIVGIVLNMRTVKEYMKSEN